MHDMVKFGEVKSLEFETRDAAHQWKAVSITGCFLQQMAVHGYLMRKNSVNSQLLYSLLFTGH